MVVALEVVRGDSIGIPRPLEEKQLLLFSVPDSSERPPLEPNPIALHPDDESVVTAFEGMMRALGERELAQANMLTSSKENFAYGLAKIAHIIKKRKPTVPDQPESRQERSKRLNQDLQCWLAERAINDLLMLGQEFWGSYDKDDGGLTFVEEFGKAYEKLDADPIFRKGLESHSTPTVPEIAS